MRGAAALTIGRQIAPSTYYVQKARQADPSRLPERARRDAVLC